MALTDGSSGAWYPQLGDLVPFGSFARTGRCRATLLCPFLSRAFFLSSLLEFLDSRLYSL
jgi:hypothetical protein